MYKRVNVTLNDTCAALAFVAVQVSEQIPVTLSPEVSRSLGFFASDGCSHRPEAPSLREKDMMFLILGTPFQNKL